MIERYKQLKELPFSKIGDIWEIDGREIIINNQNYTFCTPETYRSIIQYYTQDDGTLDMDKEWFEKIK